MAALSARFHERVRGLLFAMLALTGTVLASVAVALLINPYLHSGIARSQLPLLFGALGVTGAVVALLPAATWRSIGLDRHRLPDAFAGTLLGAAACALLVCTAIMAQWADWTAVDPARIRFDWRDAQLAGVALLAAGALGEELFVRGPFLQFLARAAGPAAAVATTSVAFALLHGANPGVTWIAQANTALFGVLFGIAVLRRGSLWLAVGLHWGWNLAQVGLGVNTSGLTIRLTDWNFEPRAAGWLTGGDYGLEGGVLATGTALLLAMALWIFPRREPRRAMLWEHEAADGAGRPGGLLGDRLAGDGQPVGNGEDGDSQRSGPH